MSTPAEPGVGIYEISCVAKQDYAVVQFGAQRRNLV